MATAGSVTPGIEDLTDDLVTDDALLLFEWICYSLVCELIDIFGTVTNVINIVCFVKQGFKDSVNVTLLGLSISDLFCLLTLVWTNVCMNPAFNKADLPFESVGFQYLSTGLLHANFTRVTSWITAFITLERCLCITAPMKVRTILTSKRTSVVIVMIFVTLLTAGCPVYFVNKFEQVYFPDRNKTLIGLVYTTDRKNVERISYVINNAFIPFSAFAVIAVCTVALVEKLHRQARWRKQSTTTSQASSISIRDQRVTKMVVMISIMFIVCFIPVCILFVAMSVVPELAVDGKYKNTIIVFIGFGFIMESINSSVNIFMYYHMSSKYRNVFRRVFNLNTKSQRNIMFKETILY